MQWLMTLEASSDPIATCRLMNILRRKGVRIHTLTMASQQNAFSLLALVESPETEIEHIFNFLRRTEGVIHVSCYRHQPSRAASFVFVAADAESATVEGILRALPKTKLIFASHGKYLLEIPPQGRQDWGTLDLGEAEFQPLAEVKTTRAASRPELVSTLAG